MLKGLFGFLALYALWLCLAVFSTLGGVFLMVLVADWDLPTLLASSLAAPALGLAAIAGLPMALIGPGRMFFLTSVGGGLLYSALAALV